MARFSRILAVFLLACGGGTASSPTPSPPPSGAPEATAEDDLTLPIGGCRETPVNDDVKRVDPGGLPWAYVVVKGGRVDCQDRRVVIQALPGLSVVLASIRDDGVGSNIAQVGPSMIEATLADLQETWSDARLSQDQTVQLGEDKRTGRCGRIDFTREGQPLVTHVCSAWATLNAQSHLILVLFTSSEADNVAAGINVHEVIGNFVDALVLEPAPIE